MTDFNPDLTVLPASADDFLGGSHLPDDTDRENSPEVRLWRAVLVRVWADAWTASNATLKTTDRRCAPDMVRAEARRWLLLDFGEWRKDREDVCTMAGIDPDEIHKAALHRRDLAGVEDQEQNRREREAIDRAMESLVAREHKLPKAAVSSALHELVAREMALA